MILSHRRDTMYHADVILHFRHRKKYLADVFSLAPSYTMCPHSKFPFQIIFGAKKFSYSFLSNLEYLEFIKYHVSVILSQSCDTLYKKVSHRRVLSRLCDSITQTWLGPYCFDNIENSPCRFPFLARASAWLYTSSCLPVRLSVPVSFIVGARCCC